MGPEWGLNIGKCTGHDTLGSLSTYRLTNEYYQMVYLETKNVTGVANPCALVEADALVKTHTLVEARFDLETFKKVIHV